MCRTLGALGALNTGDLHTRSELGTVVDEMLQVLAHAHLTHQTVLVAVHTGQLPHVGEDVLQTSVGVPQ